ncbi:MAG: hypothetical protein AAF959_22150 [Cyanobacteria bacterium P01_D01_bin.56]
MKDILGQFRNFDVVGSLFPGIILFTVIATAVELNNPNIQWLENQPVLAGIILLVFAYTAGYVLSTISMYSFWLIFNRISPRKCLWRPYLEVDATKYLSQPPNAEQLSKYASESWQMAQALAALNPQGWEPLPMAARARLNGSLGLISIIISAMNAFKAWNTSFGWLGYLLCLIAFALFHVLAYREWVYYREYLSIKLILIQYKSQES